MRRKSIANHVMVKIVFWSHMLVAAISHVAVLFLIAGSVNLLFTTEGLSFWSKGLFGALIFIASMYGVNHVTNPQGFCVLTDLENFYREKEGMHRVGAFMPRFYATCRIGFRKLFRRHK